MITPEPPAGSEHYREGWRHGYEQAAIDRERSAGAVRAAPDTAGRCGDMGDLLFNKRYCCELRAGHAGWHREGVTEWSGVVARSDADAVPDPGQARETARHREGSGAGWPRVAGRCPGCNRASLFLAAGEHVTCSHLDCPAPCAADDLLHPVTPSGDTVQAPDAAALAYARSEVDKWLADDDPYCILPTRTEHIPALLARLDELEGTR